jgi:nucleoside-diphosphate-sugar epimerase
LGAKLHQQKKLNNKLTEQIPDDQQYANNDNIAKPVDRFVFVTGGSGLVGSHVIEQLVKEGKKVKALYRSKIPEIPAKENVSWVQGDILDIISLEEAMMDVSEVYHCAAIVSFDPSEKYEMLKTNIEGTANVVDIANAAGVNKLCYVSSVAAIGKSHKNDVINETMNWSEETDKSNYGKSKYLAEMEVWRAIGEGLKAVIVNPSIILGSGNWNEGSTKIFKTAYKEFSWFSEGVTGFVDVKDLARIMTALMANKIDNARFIVSAENRSYREIFTAIAKAFNKKPPSKKVTPFLSALVLQLEIVKAIFTREKPLITKETTEAAQAIVKYDNSKLLKTLRGFKYTPIEETIQRVSKELTLKHHL